MNRILLIEDETVLRSSLARGIAKIPGVDVVDARDLSEALALIDQSTPSLIISDIDLPGRSGIELLGELGRRGLNTPVIYVSAYLKAYRAQIPPHANVDVLEKPVALADLRALIHAKLGPDADDPSAAPFLAADYLQLACTGRHSVVIDVQWATGRGEIIVVGGEVWSADDSSGVGNEAFRRLAFRSDGTVDCRTLKTSAPPRNIDGPWEALLMESARVLDEEQRDSLAAITTPTFDDIWDQAIAALLAKDYASALAAFVEARKLRPNDPKVEANIRRLGEMGWSTEEES